MEREKRRLLHLLTSNRLDVKLLVIYLMTVLVPITSHGPVHTRAHLLCTSFSKGRNSFGCQGCQSWCSSCKPLSPALFLKVHLFYSPTPSLHSHIRSYFSSSKTGWCQASLHVLVLLTTSVDWALLVQFNHWWFSWFKNTLSNMCIHAYMHTLLW